ncbi:MAG: hypothetical protein WAW07_13510 [Bacteroidales bacterium]
MFDKVCGTDKIRKEFTRTFRVESIIDLWNGPVNDFRTRAMKYFLY